MITGADQRGSGVPLPFLELFSAFGFIRLHDLHNLDEIENQFGAPSPPLQNFWVRPCITHFLNYRTFLAAISL